MAFLHENERALDGEVGKECHRRHEGRHSNRFELKLNGGNRTRERMRGNALVPRPSDDREPSEASTVISLKVC